MSLVLFNGHDLILLATVLVALFFMVQLLQLKHKHKYFPVFVVGFCISSVAIPLDLLINFGAIFHAWIVTTRPELVYLFEFGAWLQAPFVFLLVASLVDKEFKFKRVYWLMFLPFFLHSSHQVILYHSLPMAVKRDIQQSHDLMNLSVSLFFVQLSREIFRLCLISAAVLLLLKYRRLIKQKLEAWWLELFCAFQFLYVLLGVLVSTLLLLQSQFDIRMPVAFFGLSQNYLAFFCFSGLCFLLYRAGLRQQDYCAIRMYEEKDVPCSVNPTYLSLLEEFVGVQRQYTNPSLSLESLAETMGISPRTLSSVINGHFKCSFVEYINQYRLDEAKRLLIEEKKKPVLDIMYASGFNSKATFNALFKRVEGMTPSQYRKLQNQQAA